MTSEMDKFKRRLVRSVVHILKMDREAQDAAWERMQKETGCDCKLLWERMRALTVKKMKRLLAADDQHESIAAVARLTRTDWLVFDLVLVHDKYDVIGRDQIGRGKDQTERSIMEELLELVQMYRIEMLQGPQLLAAWVALSRNYNSRTVATFDKRNGTCTSGRHSSPMLLQRRWYQLKELTRANFYKLWNSYRGIQKLWEVAQNTKPTPLQAEIAKKYPQVITQPFPEWEELIQQNKVILPEQFEMHNRAKKGSKTADDKPDLVVIEPVIETIDLGEESDGEQACTSDAVSQVHVAVVKKEPEEDCILVKEEPIEDGLSNVQILDTSHVPNEFNEDSNSHFSSFDFEGTNTDLTTQMSILNTTIGAGKTSDIELPDDIIRQKTDEYPKNKIVRSKLILETSIADINDASISGIEKTSDIELPDDIIQRKADEYLKNKIVSSKPVLETSIADEDDASVSGMENTSNIKLPDDIIQQKANEYLKNKIVPSKPVVETSIADEDDASVSGIEKTSNSELADDIIKQKADEYLKSKIAPSKPVLQTSIADEDLCDYIMDDIIKQKADDFVRKVDIKNLVSDVKDDLKVRDNSEVFKLSASLTFEDEGLEFVDDGIEFIDDDDDPAEKKNKKESQELVIKAEDDQNEVIKDKADIDEENKNIKGDSAEETESTKFDLKLLMDPVVYTTKLDDMIVFKGKKIDFVQYKNIIESVILESKPVSKRAIKIETEYDDDALSQSNASQSSKTDGDDLFRNDAVSSQFPLNEQETSDDLIKKDSDAVNKDLIPNDSSNIESIINDAISKFQMNQNITTVSVDDLSKNNLDIANEDALLLNDSSRHSSNDSYESEEEIDESLKVKDTSYLLQKPRSRSYNPITLCKNPDFNTRLKRLTVGFFSSERNRKLLSACKPMTIDVHKAFEDKLLNGTLYLKTSAGSPNPIKEEIDTAASSSVIPSAMPIQSLLLKEKQTKMNIENLMKSTQMESDIDTVDLTQRSKTINLRNLSEIRRINKHLLTAQVPPMKADGNENEEPRVIRIHEGQRVASGPVAPGGEEPAEPCAPAVSSWRGGARGRGGRGTARGTARGAGRGVPPFMPARRIEAPWRIAAKKTRPPNFDEFLITIDTLNRMINKIDGTEEFRDPANKKNKRPNWAIDKHVRESVAVQVDLENSNSNDTPVSMQADTASCNKEDTNVTIEPSITDNVPEALVDVSVVTTDTTEVASQKLSKPKRAKKNKSKYCCWSREKLIKNVGSTRMRNSHKCPPICQCCCRLALLNEMKRRSTTNLTDSKVCATEPIVLSEEEIDSATCDDDSNDVRIPGFDPVDEITPVPKFRVYENANLNPGLSCMARGVSMPVASVSSQVDAPMSRGVSKLTCQEEFQVDAPTSRVVSMPVASVNSQVDAPLSTGVSMPVATVSSQVDAPTEQQPVLRINVSFTPAPQEAPPVPALIPPISPGTSSLLPETVSPNKVNLTMSRRQTLIKTSERRIVIDASDGKVEMLPKNIDDRVVFLNSKTISKKPKTSPIFLGKNKILLTTVKFPPNLETKISAPPIQPSKVVSSMQVPTGVQLVCMPSGQLTYTVDPSVHLDESQLAILPKILEAVQQQINEVNAAPAVNNCSVENSTPSSEIVSAVTSIKGGFHKIFESFSKELTSVSSVSETIESVSDEVSNVQNIQEQGQSACANSIEPDVNKAGEKKNVENKDVIGESIAVDTVTDTVNATDTTNSSKDSEIVTVEDMDDPHGPIESTASACLNTSSNDVNESTSGSRNLLSDLMEMSGISSDDMKMQEVRDNSLLPVPPGLVPLGTSLKETTESTSQVTTVAMPLETEVDSIMCVNPNAGSLEASRTFNDIKNQLLTELSPISSLAQLKYACENNGLFYKLDLDTGILSPINVCIKKNFNPRKPGPSTVQVRPVIDLTDETEVEPAKNVAKDGTIKPIRLSDPAKNVATCSPETPVGGPAKNLATYGTLKRIKILRLKRNSTLLKKEHSNYRVMPCDKCVPSPNVETEKKLRKKSRRKQSFEKIEAKIDLVDSDAPMEEEYLVESSDSDNDVSVPVENIIDSDDSSDEEPLAKKFLRLKQVKDNTTQENNEKVEDENEKNPTNDSKENIAKNTSADIAKDTEGALDAPLPVGPPEPIEIIQKEVVNNLDSEEMDIEETQFMSFLADENESQEEDCILGF